ncbi:MAG: TerB family tellurite resistance protein [Aquabacterium sp.]
MRHYPRNSPEAATRILALVLIADGHVCRSEYQVLQERGAALRLGLPPQMLPEVIHAVCEDLLLVCGGAGGLQDALIDAVLDPLMDDVDDPDLRREVINLALAVVRADGHVAEAEMDMLSRLLRRWRVFDAPNLVEPDRHAWMDAA